MKVASNKLEFIKGFEVGGLPPLPYHFEEVLPNLVPLPKYDLYKEKHFFVYCKDGFATAYQEKTEQQKSAASIKQFFSSSANRSRYLSDYGGVIEEIRHWVGHIDSIDLTKLSEGEVFKLLERHFSLYARACALAMVSKPRKLKEFEDEVRLELSKKVAKSKVDSYLIRLAVSEKPSPLDEERTEWYKFLRSVRLKEVGASLTKIVASNPESQQLLNEHFLKHKYLTIGDGLWAYDKDYFFKNLEIDKKLSLPEIDAAIAQISAAEQDVISDKKQLIDEFQLSRSLVDTLTFLSDLGHIRFIYRTKGMIPMIKTMVDLESIPIAKLGLLEDPLAFSWLLPTEFEQLTSGELPPDIKTALIERKGPQGEFLILVQDGKESIHYNDEARAIFDELQPKIVRAETDVLTGNAAVRGKVRGRVCVYKWDDDLAQKLKVIAQYPILVAGQTRPSMMPLIKKAAAIITDEGGTTSHAAIVARELGIPSIINTVHATDIFKDGDFVEVDADNGLIRKLSLSDT